MPENNNADFFKNKDAKKALGTSLLGLGVVFLIVVAYSAIHFSSQPDDNGIKTNGIKKIANYSELQKYLAENSDSYGYYGGGLMRAGAVTEQMAVTGASKSASDNSAPEASGSLSASDYSKTNIQVAGVDEADIVKTDGNYIYTVSGNNIYIVSVAPAEEAKISTKIEFSNGSVNDIFVNGDKLVVFGQVYETYAEPLPVEKDGAIASKMAARESMIYRPSSPKTAIKIYDITDRSNPSLLSEVSIEGNYYDSRMIGNYIYVIANQPTYYLYSTEKNVTVPRIYADGKAVSTVFPDIYYFDNVPGNVFSTIASINLDNPSDIASKILLTNYAQNMYVSEKNIFIVYTKWMSDADYVDRMVEIIKPLVPSDVQGKIDAAMALEVSKQTKMQAVGEILSKYTASLSPEEQKALEENAREKMQELEIQIAKEREKTVIQKVSIDNGNIEYKTSGEVPGNTLNQFSMDENGGYFRIATTTSGNGGFVSIGMGSGSVPPGIMQATVQRTEAVSDTGVQALEKEQASKTTGMAVTATSAQATSSNAGVDLKDARITDATTLKETPAPAMPEAKVAPQIARSESQNNVYVLDDNLNIVGKLEDLASGERIHSVRFLGDKAYMVTFRQIDPLYVIDLSVPDSPNVLGYLKIPGVSDYLHPYDETHVIGIGRDASEEGRIQGMKLSLFDVSDVANPKEVSKYIIGERGTDSEALHDHKAFLFSKEKNLLVIPVSEYRQIKVEGKSPENMDYWQSTYDQSAYVFNIDLVNGISLKGKISHENKSQSANENVYYYDYYSQIRRSLYIDNVLYTISQKMIKMNAIDTLNEINTVELPFEEQRYYGGGIAY